MPLPITDAPRGPYQARRKSRKSRHRNFMLISLGQALGLSLASGAHGQFLHSAAIKRTASHDSQYFGTNQRRFITGPRRTV